MSDEELEVQVVETITEGNPTGHIIKLGDNRLVWVGRIGMEGQWFFGFRNKQGDDLKFVLSEEALEAFEHLIDLRKTNPGTLDWPHKRTWRLVPKRTEGETKDSDHSSRQDVGKLEP